MPFFGLLLMYLKFVAVPGMKKISTNGKCIYFSPDFLEKLYEKEMDYILCHQILHIVCGHIWRDVDLEGDD
jgi:predicted metal-dependent peptidase